MSPEYQQLHHQHFKRPFDFDSRESYPNVRSGERIVSFLAGAALIWIGLQKFQQSPTIGVLAFIAGSALVARGFTGFCYINRLLRIEGQGTAGPNIGNTGFLSEDIPGHGGVLVEKLVVIHRPADELYRFWRNFGNLPRVMSHLQSVTENGNGSHWIAKGPAGTSIEWRARIMKVVPNRLIAWRSLPGATVPNSGSVRFKPLTDTTTEVRVILEYSPPAGKLGVIAARFFGEEPGLQIADDLQRFKQIMESGEDVAH